MRQMLTRDEQTALRCLKALKQIRYPLEPEMEELFQALQARADAQPKAS